MRGVWWLCAGALVVCGAWLVSKAAVRRGLRAMLAPAALLVGVPLVMSRAEGPTARWRHNAIGAGRIEVQSSAAQLWAQLQIPRTHLVWEADGWESSIAVMGFDGYSFRVNGKRGLVIGLGTGMSAGWLAAVPTIEHVDVVELEPAMTEVARMCGPLNFDVLENPQVRVVHGDAREWVQTASERWDVVMSEPSNPYRSGVASLFSQEFYRTVADRLDERGVFVQWLQSYEVDASAVATVIATLRSVFPSVEIWVTSSGDLALVSRKHRDAHDLGVIAARVEAFPYADALEKVWGVSGVDGLFGAYLAGPGLADAIAARPGVRIERDDRPSLEFGFSRSLGGDDFVSSLDVLEAAGTVDADRPALVGGALNPARVGEARHVLGGFLEAEVGDTWVSEDPAFEARREARDLLGGVSAGLGDAVARWREQPETPRHPHDRLRFAAALGLAGDADARRAADELRAQHPADAALFEARLAYASEDREATAEALTRAFVAARTDPWFTHSLMYDAMHRLALDVAEADPDSGERLFRVLGTPFVVDASGGARVRARLALARRLGFAARCADALAPFEPQPPLESRVLQARVDCYTGDDPRADDAAALQDWFVSLHPDAPWLLDE
jgi:hypothetical protein